MVYWGKIRVDKPKYAHNDFTYRNFTFGQFFMCNGANNEQLPRG